MLVYHRSSASNVENKIEEVNRNEMFSMLEDAVLHLEGINSNEHKTNSYRAGMKQLFRGFAVKD